MTLRPPGFIAITPDGKTAYVANTGLNTVTPISTATNTAGKPIPVGPPRPGSRSPRTGRPPTSPTRTTSGARHGHPDQHRHQHARQADPVGDRVPDEIAITPDGKTAYVQRQERGQGTVTPISTATNTPGKPIHVRERGRLWQYRDHPGREDRLRRHRRPAHGHPDQHGHQQARQADPRRRPNSLSRRPDRDHPGREDRLRRHALGHGRPDQHRHQHPRQADPASRRRLRPSTRSRSPRTGRPPTSPRQARSSRSAPPPTPPASRSTSPARVYPRDRDHAMTCAGARPCPG